jgi:hypothetical protein
MLPAEFSLTNEIERRETWDSDTEAGDRDSDWEDSSSEESTDDDPMDEDYIPTLLSEHDDNTFFSEDETPEDSDHMDDDFIHKYAASSPNNGNPTEFNVPELPHFTDKATHRDLSVLPRKPSLPINSQDDSTEAVWTRTAIEWVNHAVDFFSPEMQIDVSVSVSVMTPF